MTISAVLTSMLQSIDQERLAFVLRSGQTIEMALDHIRYLWFTESSHKANDDGEESDSEDEESPEKELKVEESSEPPVPDEGLDEPLVDKDRLEEMRQQMGLKFPKGVCVCV
jgi:hypothetical protein